MKKWAKKLEEMVSNPDVQLTDEEASEMMTDIINGADVEGFKVRAISVEELAELDAVFPYKTPTIH